MHYFSESYHTTSLSSPFLNVARSPALLGE